MYLRLLFTVFIGFSNFQTINALLWNETYPKGQVVRLGDFDVYSVGSTTSDAAIIVIYDILGFNTSQTRVFCDRLASNYSIQVVMPDVYRGTARPSTGDISAWLTAVNNWTSISTDLKNVANWLRNTYSKKYLGLAGFCWGGLQVVRACSNISDLFTTGISIHGSRITSDEVIELKKPILFIAAGNDPALHPNISSTIQAVNPELNKRCEYRTYINSMHGFVAAGANYSNPNNVQAIDDVFSAIHNYLDKTLRNMSSSLKQNFYLSIFFVILLFYINL